jgi:hypothetical protein
MFGGLRKSTSVFALAAVAGLAMGSMSAQAADLGGDCCADLEERVAELEATTARKGNRKVSLTVYGQVTTAVMFWDASRTAGRYFGSDGRTATVDRFTESNVYVVDPQTSGTRFGFKGGAKITHDWSAGYRLELQWQNADATKVRKDNDEGNDLPEFRQAHWWLKSKTFGKIRVGQADTANSGIAEIDVSGTNIADGMSSSQAGAAIISDDILGPAMTNYEFNRRNVVRYDTPTYAGFILSAAWGEDDLWDVALRYAGEFGGFKLAGGIAYGQATDNTASLGDGAYTPLNGDGGQNEPAIEVLNGGLSMMHVPTGLFATGSGGQRKATGTVACDDLVAGVIPGKDPLKNNGNCDTEWFWFAKAGIKQRWWSIGSTALFGMGGQQYDAIDRSIHYWGLGVVQKIDAAAMDLYVSYRDYYDIDTGYTPAVPEGDFQTVVAGGRIKF